MSKNLDEVIKGVPLDLGDNLEQIEGDLHTSIASSVGLVTSTSPPPLMATSPNNSVRATTTITTVANRPAELDSWVSGSVEKAPEVTSTVNTTSGADNSHLFEALGPKVMQLLLWAQMQWLS